MITIKACQQALEDSSSPQLLIEFCKDYLNKRTLRWIGSQEDSYLLDFENNTIVNITKDGDIYIVKAYKNKLYPDKLGFNSYSQAKEEVNRALASTGYIIKD